MCRSGGVNVIKLLSDVSYLFLVGALHLEAQRQLTERRYRHRVGHLGDLAVSTGYTDLLVPESHGD